MSTSADSPSVEWQLQPGVAEQYSTAYQQRWKRRCEQHYTLASTRRVYAPPSSSTHPTSTPSTASHGQPANSAPASNSTNASDRPFILWADRRKTILEHYKTDRPVSIVPNIRASLQLPHSSSNNSSSGDSTPPVVQQQPLQPSKPIFDSTRTPQPKDGRLDELYLYEDHASKLPHSNVSAAEYQQWCQQLLNDLLYYWIEAGDRLSSLKLCVFAARQLCDTSNVSYYPVQYVYLTDVLTTFGDLVYTRIRSRGRQASSAGSSSSSSSALPANFHSTDVNERARETARNWFFRISTVRSVTIRVYLELALLKAYRFIIRTEEFARIIKRLSRSIRGIGDPMVATYARCYLADRATDLSLSLVTPITQSSKPDVIESSITRSSSISRSSSSDGTPPSSVHNTPSVDRKTVSRLPSNEQKQAEPLQRLIQYALPSDQKQQSSTTTSNNRQPAPRNRQAILVRTFHQTLIETWYDFILTFHKCSNKQWSIVPAIAEQKLDPEQYIALFQPAVDYLCNIIGYHGRDELLQAVLSSYREQAHGHPMILTTIIKSFDSSLLVEKANEIIQLITTAAYNVDEQGGEPAAVLRPKSLEHVSDDQQSTDANTYKILTTYTPSLLYTHLGLALRRHAPPLADRLTILNTIWKHVAQLVDFYAYLQLACIYAPYVARQLTEREISIFAADVYQHVQKKRAGQMVTYLYKNSHIQNGVRNILTALYTEVPDSLYESVVVIPSVNKLLNEVLDRSHRQQVLLSCIQRLERSAVSATGDKPNGNAVRDLPDKPQQSTSTIDHLRTVQEATVGSKSASSDASPLGTCLRLTQTPVQQLLMEFCVLLATHLTTASTADERLSVSNAIVTFIRHLQFGRDVESHLQLLKTLSQSLSATPVPLHVVRAEILQHMLYLAVRTHKWCYGRHTAESSQFVTTCIQNVHQQLPTINELRYQLPLYVASMEAALLCAQSQDRGSEHGQLSSLQLYLYRNAVSCIKIAVNSIAGLSNVNPISVDVPLHSLLQRLSSIILLLPPPSVTSPTQTTKSPLYYVLIFVDTVINAPAPQSRCDTSELNDTSDDALIAPLTDELPNLPSSHRLLSAVLEMLVAAKHMSAIASKPAAAAEHNQLITDVVLTLKQQSQTATNGSDPYPTTGYNHTMLTDWLQRLFDSKQVNQLLRL